MNDDVPQKCKRLIAGHRCIPVLEVAQIIRARFVVSFTCLSASGDLGWDDTVVRVVVRESLKPRGAVWRASNCKWLIPRFPGRVQSILYTEHVHLRRISAVFVVKWVIFGVDLARRRVATPDPETFTTNLAAIVSYGVVCSLVSDWNRPRVRLGAVGRIVVCYQAGARIRISSVERHVLSDEHNMVSRLYQLSFNVHIVSATRNEWASDHSNKACIEMCVRCGNAVSYPVLWVTCGRHEPAGQSVCCTVR